MARGELIVNRVHSHGLDGHVGGAGRELLAPELGDSLAPLAGAWQSNLADFDVLAARDRDTIAIARSFPRL
jgi:hypothetical protein